MLEQVEQYEGLIRHITAKYQFWAEYDDLYQAGMVGLVSALQKYDATKESDFLNYAYLYVKGEVLKALNASKQLKVSPDIYKLQQEVAATRDDLLQTFGREPTTLEISYVLGKEVQEVEQVQQLTIPMCSLDETTEENYGLYQQVAKIEMGYDAGILDLKTAILGLEESERQLITSRYYEDRTQRETADALGMSQVQVSRKEQKILAKLNDCLGCHS